MPSPTQLKKTGSSTVSSLLALKVALRGGKIAPCPKFEALTNSSARFWNGHVLTWLGRSWDYDVVLNHCSSVFAAERGNAGRLAINNVFGSAPLEVMTVRNPLDRAVSMYYWFGGQKSHHKQVPGVQSRLKGVGECLSALVGCSIALLHAASLPCCTLAAANNICCMLMCWLAGADAFFCPFEAPFPCIYGGFSSRFVWP